MQTNYMYGNAKDGLDGMFPIRIIQVFLQDV
jgi:hypothetical protein